MASNESEGLLRQHRETMDRLRKQIEDAGDALSDSEVQVLRLTSGLEDGRGWGHDDVAQRLGITEEDMLAILG
ncbi:MAG: hypothetical protein HY532_08090, partial [Chloroflexi bacterium]|nr:hypothetical protein [Chloroflexota bacterium]